MLNIHCSMLMSVQRLTQVYSFEIRLEHGCSWLFDIDFVGQCCSTCKLRNQLTNVLGKFRLVTVLGILFFLR